MDGKFFILAGSFGRSFAEEVKGTNGADFLLSPDGESVVKPLQTVAEIGCIGQWIQAIQACPRMLPVAKKVFIVCNDDHMPQYHAWAATFKTPEGTFPVENIISNGSHLSDAQRPGDAADLALGVQQTGATGWVFAASADHCLAPFSNLNRFLEAALISGASTIACRPPHTTTSKPSSASTQHAAHLAVQLRGAWGVVAHAALTASSLQGADTLTSTAAATIPLIGLHPRDLPTLAAHGSSSGACPWQSLDRLIVGLAGVRALTAVHYPAAFSIRTLRDLLFTDMFFAHWKNRALESAAMGVPAARGGASMDALLGVEMPEASAVPAAGGALSLQLELSEFVFDFAEALVNRSKFAWADLLLPPRFTRVGDWSYAPRRKQHSSYTTANSTYGQRSPNQSDMPMTWHGCKGQFTNTFQGMTRDKGLRCFTECSKVHKAFDEYTHYQ